METKRTPPKMTHEELIAKWMQDPAFRAEYEHLEDEFAALDDKWNAMTREGIADAAAGNLISTEEMLAFVDRLSEGEDE